VRLACHIIRNPKVSDPGLLGGLGGLVRFVVINLRPGGDDVKPQSTSLAGGELRAEFLVEFQAKFGDSAEFLMTMILNATAAVPSRGN
jgi:hypothetical protein